MITIAAALSMADAAQDVAAVLAPAVPWLASLEPTAAGWALVPASSGAQLSRAVQAVGETAAQWAVETGQRVAERVLAEIPGHAADGAFDVLRMGTESTVIQLLVALEDGEPRPPVTPESLGGVPDFVQRRVSLDEMLRGIHLGHSVIAGAFLAECALRGDADLRHEQMRVLSHHMFSFFDEFSTGMVAAYRGEEARWLRSDAAARLALVDAILSGHDPHPISASRRLRYDLSRTHVALMVWTSGRTLDADQDALHEAACDLLRQSGCDQKLVLTPSLGVVWAWATPKFSPEVLAERLAAAQLPPFTHVAFGVAGAGVAGFRASHDDARAAFALRSELASAQAVTSYRDVDLLSLLLADRERAQRFARRELGELARHDAQVAELRRTVAAYIDAAESPHVAAERLQVSRNTVTHRVRRAEELLGRPLSDRRQHLRAALEIHDECARWRHDAR